MLAWTCVSEPVSCLTVNRRFGLGVIGLARVLGPQLACAFLDSLVSCSHRRDAAKNAGAKSRSIWSTMSRRLWPQGASAAPMATTPQQSNSGREAFVRPSRKQRNCERRSNPQPQAQQDLQGRAPEEPARCSISLSQPQARRWRGGQSASGYCGGTFRPYVAHERPRRVRFEGP